MSVFSAWQWVWYITNVMLYHSLTLYHSRTDKLSKMLVYTAFVKKIFTNTMIIFRKQSPGSPAA